MKYHDLVTLDLRSHKHPNLQEILDPIYTLDTSISVDIKETQWLWIVKIDEIENPICYIVETPK